MYKRILVATDGSTLSKKAVRSAIDLAGAVGAELVALYVVPRYPTAYFEGGVTISSQDVARIEKQWADKGKAVVEAVKLAAQGEGIKARAVIASSDLVAESIINAAKKQKCDLVVMASHGRKGIKRVLLGSETQHVLTHSSVPVLVLR
ncbi:universal stress protein [Polaromonas sp. A23]|uniref:universal stress protein n=1 Tax=Polaromonas sp. A23 TaxID=1944133 RepID=UPI000986E897|nr:universal stress protein [Polaromonas sp. A23]OOG36721.1 universal stress protein UspA [Polaromonas sp. A23]